MGKLCKVRVRVRVRVLFSIKFVVVVVVMITGTRFFVEGEGPSVNRLITWGVL